MGVRRAPTLADRSSPRGNVAWEEHEAAAAARRDNAEAYARRGGYSFEELTRVLGRKPTTWLPGDATPEDVATDRRAPVLGRRGGTVSWVEFQLAYVRSGDRTQTADGIADRGGYSYGEITTFLGHEPKTWRAG